MKELLGSSSKSYIMDDSNSNSTAHAGWYTFSKNSAGEYSLYQVEGKYLNESGSKLQTSYTYSGEGKDVTENGKVSFLYNKDNTNKASVYANNDTIVIVDDGDDVTVYTGVKNLPDITLTDANAKATVVTLSKSNGYAYYVFISVDGKASISGNSDETLTYFVKYDGQHKGTDNDVYYTYKTLDSNGDETVVKADSILNGFNGSNKNIYNVWYKLRTNSDEEITSATTVPNSGKYISGNGNALTTTAGALYLGSDRYTTTDDAKITLVVLQTSSGLNKDKEADYEVTTGLTAKSLSDTLKGYKVTYNYAGKVTDTSGSVIEELFVTVTDATYTGSTPSTPSTGVSYKMDAWTTLSNDNPSGNVNVVICKTVNGVDTWMTQADLVKLGLTVADFEVTTAGKTYAPVKPDSGATIKYNTCTSATCGNQALIDANAGFIKVHFDVDTLASGSAISIPSMDISCKIVVG